MSSSKNAATGDHSPSAPASPSSRPSRRPQSNIPEIEVPEPEHPPAPPQRRVSFHSSIADQKLLMSRRPSAHRAPSPAPNTRHLPPPDDDEEIDESSAMLNNNGGTGKRNYSTTATNDDGAPTEHNSTLERRSSKGSLRKYQDHPSWWKRAMDKYGSVELENKGSVARDHLALERTFLAWLRTSLSFASIGIAITQLFRLNTSIRQSSESTDEDKLSRVRHVGKPLGATFLGVGILVLLLGFHRYFESQHYVILGRFPASRGSVTLVTVSATALIISCLIVVLVKAPTTS